MKPYFSSAKLADLTKEICSSGVVVLYCPTRFMNSVDKESSSLWYPKGRYFGFKDMEPDISGIQLQPFNIFINKNLSNCDKCVTLFHEYGHHLCFTRGCKCCSNTIKNEFHAIRYSLKLMLRRGYIRPLFGAMTDVCKFLEPRRRGPKKYYHYASRKIIRDPIWAQCDFLLHDELKTWMLERYGTVKDFTPKWYRLKKKLKSFFTSLYNISRNSNT